MKTIATILFTIVLATASANEYENAMKAALQNFNEAQSVENLQDAANQFTRIGSVAKTEWLPRYYAAQSYIRMAFRTSLDAATRDGYLDQAQGYIDEMHELKSDLSEVYALQSMLYTARLVIDPMSRGQEMMIKSGTAISQSLALNQNNPRAAYLQLSNEMGQAQFFGKDVSTYCPRVKGLLNAWDELNDVPELYPSWGKAELEGLSTLCE